MVIRSKIRVGSKRKQQKIKKFSLFSERSFHGLTTSSEGKTNIFFLESGWIIVKVWVYTCIVYSKCIINFGSIGSTNDKLVFFCLHKIGSLPFLNRFQNIQKKDSFARMIIKRISSQKLVRSWCKISAVPRSNRS